MQQTFTGHLQLSVHKGVGVPNESEGMMYIGLAAGQGNDTAAKLLGAAYADGLHGFPVNKEKARYWLQKSISGECPIKSMTSDGKLDAQEQLDSLQGLQHI